MDLSLRAIVVAAIAGLFVIGLALALLLGFFDKTPPAFHNGFESGVVELDAWQVDDDGTCRFEVVNAPVREGSKALRIDSRANGRCEVLPWVGSNVLGRLIREPFEHDRWYAFSVYLPEDWQHNDQNEVIAQWHGSKDIFLGEEGGRGPPLALRIVGSEWRVTHGADADFLSEPGPKAFHIGARRPITKGAWTDWLFNVRWSWNKTGNTQVWMNGQLIAVLPGANAYNDLRGVYLKLGSYHPGTARTLLLDDVYVGDERP